jgi:hypothetical protein
VNLPGIAGHFVSPSHRHHHREYHEWNERANQRPGRQPASLQAHRNDPAHDKGWASEHAHKRRKHPEPHKEHVLVVVAREQPITILDNTRTSFLVSMPGILPDGAAESLWGWPAASV